MRLACEQPLGSAAREQSRAHVQRLCVEHDLCWVEDLDYWLASCSDDGQSIHTPPLTSEMDYLAAVHEVGHFALGGLPTHAADGETVLFENEERVWLWTLEQLPQAPSESARALIYGCFRSYEGQMASPEIRERMKRLLDY